MRDNPLQRILDPSSIAIVGASNTFSTMGTIQCLNLMNCGFTGEVMPIHHREETVLGKKAFARIADLPYAPDLAVLVVPTRFVPSMLEEFGKLGTRHAVIITAGFREIGEEGSHQEQHLVSVAERYGIRFLGPNCLGIVNTHLPLNITVFPIQDFKGKLGLASQSGSYVAQVVSYLHKNGISLSKAISVGNEADIDITDCIEYLGEDESTRAIGLYIEGIRDAHRFLEVARTVSTKKPIVAQYVGGTDAGARSGSSHTGAMAGPDYMYDGLFAQAGIIRVDTIEEVYKVGWALATQEPPRGRRIAVLTNSGGPGTGIATTCEKYGLLVPEFSNQLQEKISTYLPGHASARNPVDLTFHVEMSALTEHIPRTLFESDEIDGVIAYGIMDTGFIDMLYPFMKDFVKLEKEDLIKMFELSLDPLLDMPRAFEKPLLISSFFGKEDHCIRLFHQHGIPTFDSPEKAARAMAALYQYSLIRDRVLPQKKRPGTVPSAARTIMEDNPGPVIDEFHSKKLLAAYGMPTTREYLATSRDEVLAAARSIGFPVAVKGCSPNITHKTERGLVHLNIVSEQDLHNAYTLLAAHTDVSRVIVSEMLTGSREFMAGMSRHKGFPPCIMFGLGGINAEILRDFTIRLAPLIFQDALEMIEGIKAASLLDSFRNMPPVEREQLAELLVSLGEVSLAFPEIKEIDLNPITVVDGKPKIADAIIIRG
ncbi:MAG TPA: CoA-binding protein [Deltaproteobacteria bacterium]|nr:CoA-binding protein [Deltaproteobacteria bacterium]